MREEIAVVSPLKNIDTTSVMQALRARRKLAVWTKAADHFTSLNRL
jgi:hypothetical protein